MAAVLIGPRSDLGVLPIHISLTAAGWWNWTSPCLLATCVLSSKKLSVQEATKEGTLKKCDRNNVELSRAADCWLLGCRRGRSKPLRGWERPSEQIENTSGHLCVYFSFSLIFIFTLCVCGGGSH